MNIDVYRSLIDFNESKRAIEFEVVRREPFPVFEDGSLDLDQKLYWEPESYNI